MGVGVGVGVGVSNASSSPSASAEPDPPADDSDDGGSSSSPSELTSLEELIEGEVKTRIEGTQFDDGVMDAWTLSKIEADPIYNPGGDSLGEGGKRYYATFVSEFTGEVFTFSVNFNPVTRQFGIVKPSSQQK